MDKVVKIRKVKRYSGNTVFFFDVESEENGEIHVWDLAVHHTGDDCEPALFHSAQEWIDLWWEFEEPNYYEYTHEVFEQVSEILHTLIDDYFD